jgi:hypothetical protein
MRSRIADLELRACRDSSPSGREVVNPLPKVTPLLVALVVASTLTFSVAAGNPEATTVEIDILHMYVLMPIPTAA